VTPRERAMTALRGGRPDVIPFLAGLPPPVGTMERELRNRGMCIDSGGSSLAVHTPNVKTTRSCYQDGQGRSLEKTTLSSPFGELSELSEPAGFTSWKHEYLYKSQGDYKKLAFVIKDSVVEPCYDRARQLLSERGEDVLTVDWLIFSPLLDICYKYMGTQTFCIEWMDNRDEILKLYAALVDLKRRMLQIVAQSPYEVVIYDANIVPQITGAETIRKYLMPNWEEAVAILHKTGKLVGGHFDADNTPIMELIAQTGFDFIQAYDAGCNPPVSVARKAWPGKVLWLNYPCAWHLLPPEEIKRRTIRLIEEAEPGNGFIIGITETVPPERILQNYGAIMDGIDEYCL